MSEIIKPPIQLEIAGVSHQFEYGLTSVHAYRYAVDQPFNHIEAVTYGTQTVRIFNCLPQMMFLVGQELPGHDFNKKQIKQITSEMDRQVGWEADFVLSDEAPDDIKERYIKLSTAILRREVVVVPKGW